MNKILSSFALLLLSVWSIAQTSADLKLNLEKNKVYRFNSLTEQNIAQTVNGIQQNVESKTDYTVSLRMVDATADFMITEARFDSVKISTNTMGKISQISSAVEGNVKSAEAAEIMSYFMNRFCKNAIFIKMDYSGKVLEVVNSKMLSSIVLKDTSAITLSGPVASAVKTQVVNLFSDNALKNMIEMFTYNLPGKQVAAGDSWDITQKINSGGMLLDIKTGFRLNGLKDGVAMVTSESDLKAAENAEPINSGGARVTYDDLKGMGKANLTIDTRTGLPAENTGKLRISGNLGVSMPGMNMQIPMEINGESKITALP